MVDVDVAEDVVAEAYLLAARSFRKFDPTRAKFSTWVTKIAINCMNSYYRKERRTVALDEVAESAFATPDDDIAFADRDEAIRLLRCLNDIERRLVVMKYCAGYKNVEIAEELSMNASTVSTILARALAKMRKVAESGS